MTIDPASLGFLAEVRGRIEECDLRGASLVVAVSGGPDSFALIHALHALREDLDLELHVAHLDHGLRASASPDAEFVRSTMSSMGVSTSIDTVDVTAFRVEHRLSIEDAARRLRYRFLARVAAEQHADAIALGHTLDDQAETVLMRMIRGSGLDGLRAMSVFSQLRVDDSLLPLFRPLLHTPRSAILEHCAENGLSPRLDESNLSANFTRNSIRLKLMPALETYNPSVRSALGRLAESISHDVDFIHQQVGQAARDVVVAYDSGVHLDRNRFAQLHPSLRRHLLRHAVQEITGSLTDLTQTHVAAMLDIIAGPSGRSVHLPRGLYFFTDHRRAYLQRTDSEVCPLPAMDRTPFQLVVPGESTSGDWKVVGRILQSDRPWTTVDGRGGLRFTETFDAESLGPRLVVRQRAPGDRFQPLGMSGHTKLKEFMIDTHIPKMWRDRVPLVEAQGKIVWVVGWRIADWAKVTESTQARIEISFERITPGAESVRSGSDSI